tara:strand:- start:12324 stop:12518 length:195 start_codon:yes stop_codon:yes gene_type:complete
MSKKELVVETDSKIGYAVIPTKKVAYYSEDYVNLRRCDKLKKAALKASDNGRCWWIYQYILYHG